MLVPSFPQHSIQANKGVEGCDWHSHLHGFAFPALVLQLKLYWGWSRINRERIDIWSFPTKDMYIQTQPQRIC